MSAVKAPTMTIQVGDVIANKFRIERELGRGGVGTVFLATHLQLDERVALKFVAAAEAIEQVIKEARACLRLKTEHIARVMDVGRHNDAAFIVMEYLEGKDLHTMLEQDGRLEDPMEAVELVTQICEAVAEAHRVGVVHRDIKLANLFLVASRSALPLVKLLDFGIAASTTDNVKQHQTVGTLHYMAPEALRGVSDDPRTDIWALGVVLFELLTGWKPFNSTDTVTLIAEIFEQGHLSLRSYRPDLPEALEVIIDRCLEKEPDDRFQSAGELAEALAPFAPARAQKYIERALAAGAPVAASATTDPTPLSSKTHLRAGRSSSNSLKTSGARTRSGASSSTSIPEPESTKKWLSFGVAGVAVVGLIVVIAKFGAQTRSPTTPPTASVAAPSVPTSSAVGAPAESSVPPAVTPAPTDTTASAPAETASAHAAAPPARTAPFAQHLPAPRQPVASPARSATIKATGPAGATPSAPTATSTTTNGLDRDPWRANQPKLEDSPFR